jgi:hypothetical protein
VNFTPFQYTQTPGVVPPGSITNAELADMVAHTVKARATNSTGSPEDVPIDATLVFPSNTSLGRAALTGDVTAAQGSNATTIAANAVTDAKFRQSAANSVVGRASNTVGNVADIVAGTNDRLLAQTGGALSFVQATNGMIPTNTVGLDKLANAGAQYDIVGRKTAAGGAWEDCTRTQLLLAGTDLANTFSVGGQVINGGVLTALKVTQTTSGLTNTDAALVLESTDAGASGPTLVSYHNGASPAANDVYARWRHYFNNSTPAAVQGSAIQARVNDVTAGSEDTQIEFNTFIAGALNTQLIVGNGTRARGLTDPGDQNANFLNYFVNGVNINAIYAGLAGAAFTGAVTVTSGAARSVKASQSTAGLTPTDAVLVLESTDTGGTGPHLVMYHNKAAGAANDVIRFRPYFNNASGTLVNTGGFAFALAVATAGAEDSTMAFATIRAGTLATRMQLHSGLFMNGATGGDQGANTINASGYYVNGNIVADASGLLRGPGFTVGTLPAAGGVTGGRTRVSDSNAAITAGIGAVVAAGGANVVPVFSDGTNWRIA